MGRGEGANKGVPFDGSNPEIWANELARSRSRFPLGNQTKRKFQAGGARAARRDRG